MAPTTVEEVRAITDQFDPLYKRLPAFREPRALLVAHYTSVQTIEKIIVNNEAWLSNPLYMNDLGELRTGIAIASHIFADFASQATNQDASRTQKITQAFDHYLSMLHNEQALDTYIFCLCIQRHDDTDGLLSMWREYGSKGNGAALVFNAAKLSFIANGPFIISPVVYATDAERETQLRDHLTAWAKKVLELKLPDEQLFVAAYAAFQFIKLVALTTKHSGFSEEKEVRIIYLRENDPRGLQTSNLSYFVGARGVEPKLKFKFGPVMKNTDGKDPPLEVKTGELLDLLEYIMLGPTTSSPLAKAAFIRMLQSNNLGNLASKVLTSSIPMRPHFPI